MRVEFDASELRALVRQVVVQVLVELQWPTGRLAVSEAEAAVAVGVNRHVLRDLRLAGKVSFSRVGRKIVYRQSDLRQLLQTEGV